jgi:eukaryotic-like serine/threonine-protein kinase
MAWVTGQKLYGDRYTIERFLGQGGFGVAYLARDKKGDRIVIKTLKEQVLNNPKLAPYRQKYQQNFREEALRLALCRHPHIVHIDNAFYEGELPCIAMEYVEGEDLRHRIKQRGALSELEALLYIWQIAKAVMVIHDKGMLHQDIKPPNIMVRAGKAEAVLIDFGIAREFITTISHYQTTSYTGGFSPIEQYTLQANRGEYTDVYSLAATLYYMLTAKVPTPAPGRAAKLPLVPPREHNPSISAQVNEAILKGMEFEPEKRPQSVQAWLDLLGSTGTMPTTLKLLPLSAPSLLQLPPPPPPPRRVGSISTLSSDYSHLRELLAQKRWKEADLETELVMLRVARVEKEGWLNLELINRFPWEDLRTIDQLWVMYSNGRFGFRVQKRIWQEIGGKVDYQTERRLGDRVGWRQDNSWLNYDDLTFSLDAPAGHLPARGSALWARGCVFFGWAWWVFFDKGVFSRGEACKL